MSDPRSEPPAPHDAGTPPTGWSTPPSPPGWGVPPSPPGWGAPVGWGAVPSDPGPIPLRPLTVGDVLGAGLGVVRRHFALLAPVAVLIAVLSSAAVLGILGAYGSLQDFASGAWSNTLISDFAAGKPLALPTGTYLALSVSSVISIAGTLAVAGLAAACAGVDAMGRHGVRGALRERLAGRVGPLLATAAIVGVGVLAGLTLFIVPGVLLYLIWAVAAPIAAMERSGPGAALARSVKLTRGHRGRILGVTLLILVITFAIETVLSAAVQTAAGSLVPVASLIVSNAVTALVAAVTTSWVGAVMALLYVDIRLRTENLAPALRAFAAADRATRTGGRSGEAGGPALGPA